MVGLFASLKWQLVTSRLRARTGSTRALAIVGLCAAGLGAALVALVLGLLSAFPSTALSVAALLLTSQVVAWMLSPLIAFGVDETVDPQRFALLPIPLRSMLAGLTAAAAIGWLPAANVVVLVGVAVAISPSGALLPLALLCMAAHLLMCIVLSRAASTSLADLMSTRRGRDLGMLVGFGVFVVYFAVNAGLSRLSRNSSFTGSLTHVSDVLSWTPPGALATIPTLVHDGELGLAVAKALLAIATIVLGYWWWAVALRRSLESGTSVTESSSPAAARGFSDAGGTIAVVAHRDRVLVWRDPMRRLPWMMVGIFMIGMPFVWVQGHGAMFTVAFGAVMSGTQVGNQFGVDGSGMWLHVVALRTRRQAAAEIVGHLLLAVIPGALLILVAVPLHAVIRGDLALVPVGWAICLSALVGAAAIASFMSAAKPYAMPQSRGSMFASSTPQHKGRAFVVSMSVILGGAAFGLPAAAFVPLAVQESWWGWVALLVGPAIAIAVGQLLVRRAAGRYFETAPEIFAAVRVGDRV